MAVATMEETMFAPVSITAPEVDGVPAELEFSVETLEVQNEEQATFASSLLREIKNRQKVVEDAFSESVNLAHRAHKALTALRGRLLEPYTTMERAVKGKVLAWQQEEQRQAQERARAERERLEAKRAETERLAQEEARAAAATGDMLAQARAQEALEQAQTMPVAAIVEMPAAPKVEGVSVREVWKYEVEDIMALVAAVAAGKAPVDYLMVNDKVVGGIVKSLKGATNIPGIRVVKTGNVAVR